MSRSSARRGQTEPLAALAAVLAVGVALALYAEALTVVDPSPSEPGVADATVDRALAATSDGAVARPDRLPAAVDVAPGGHAVNASLAAAGRTWTVGPAPPPDAPNATRSTSVRVRPGDVRPGRLRVEVWT